MTRIPSKIVYESLYGEVMNDWDDDEVNESDVDEENDSDDDDEVGQSARKQERIDYTFSVSQGHYLRFY